MVKDTILYDRLEISPNASDNEIKKAFMRLSKVWHPDKNDNSEESTKKFQELNEAKEILLDSQKRELYNKIGMDVLSNNGCSEDPFEHFSQFFGRGFGFESNVNKREEFNDIEEIVNVSLEQLYNEDIIDFSYNYKQFCQKCNGEGTSDGLPSKCNDCDGKGMKVQIIKIGPMIQQIMNTCGRCNGSGKNNNSNSKCNTCNGSSFINKEKTIQVPLKSGLTHGNIITLQNKGNQYKQGKSNLKLVINELKHNNFRHVNNDLFITIDIKLYQALFGYHKIIKHLNGKELYITFNKLTNFNMIKKIPNEGMKRINGGKGDLYIKFNILLPQLELLDNIEYKEHLKRLLQVLDQDDVKSENLIINTPNLSQTNLHDCNQEISNNILRLLNDLETENNNDNQYKNKKQQQQQAECVHQ
jgi:DnaJ family protein A protein 2